MNKQSFGLNNKISIEDLAFANTLKKQEQAQNDDKKECLLVKSTEKNKNTQEKIINSVLEVKEYDQSCEDFSKIEKIIIINYSKPKLILFALINFFTAFIINLIVIWYPELQFYFIYSEADVNEGEFVAIYGSDKKFYISKLEEVLLPNISNSHLKIYCESNINMQKYKQFRFKLYNYIYNENEKNFKSIKFNIKTTQEKIHKIFTKGLNSEEIIYQRNIFGNCDLVVKIDSVVTLFLKEVTDPFYIFQIFSIILWFYYDYEPYAIVILVTTVISLGYSVYETRVNLVNIQQMARYTCKLNVFRQSEDKEKKQIQIDSTELVPGDLFEIPDENISLPCDAILISGSLILNESMLTGESTPIIKTHLPQKNQQFEAKTDYKFLIYAGTKIVQKRALGNSKAMGIVYSTGFNTVKGNLIRSILYPKEVEFKFKKDSVRYIFFMAGLSFVGYFISVPFMLKNGIDYNTILERSLDLLTTTVPPSLPACLGIGISYALFRLRKWGIICINRDRVNVSGRVNMVCFDKTGTLTEDHLDVYGFRPTKLSKSLFCFDSFASSVKEIQKEAFDYYKEMAVKDEVGASRDRHKELEKLFVECVAACHGITRVHGKIVGDPIDVKMFEESGWQLNKNADCQENYDSLISTNVRPPQEKDLNEKLSDPNCEDEDLIIRSHYELGIVKRFDFSSKLMRMSTLVKNVNEPYFKAFCKGSPEKLIDLCKPETIPTNFNEILSKYTTKGFRVLALGAKILKMDYMQSQKIDRNVIESNMIFLGLLIVQNKLKHNTTNTIEKLANSNLRMVMATGDNLLTAISVAKECNLIDPDCSVYTCDLIKENNQNNLKWTPVENFRDSEDESKSGGPEEALTLNLNPNRRFSLLQELEYKTFTKHFSPESIGEQNSFGEAEANLLREQPKMPKSNSEEPSMHSELINLDIENAPFPFDNNNNNNSSFENANCIIAITGQSFEALWKLRNKFLQSEKQEFKQYHEAFRKILQNGYIFARMLPEHKTILVECLRDEKFTVLMCGDGANDCGALRAADVGVSLSIEDASIAAHFTSNRPDISCLIKLLREGKASLATSIQTFKYMIMYSLIQFIAVSVLVVLNSYLTDSQFLVSDFFITFPVAFLIGRTGAYEKLTVQKPNSALVSLPIITSIAVQTFIQTVAQVGIYVLLVYQKGFSNECVTDEDAAYPCLANSAIFLVSNIQYLITALAFSISKPFRKPIYTNYSLCIFLILSIGYSIYIIVDPDHYSRNLMDLKQFDRYPYFKYYILIFTLLNFIFSYFVESSLIPCVTQMYKRYKYKKLINAIKQRNATLKLRQLQKMKGE